MADYNKIPARESGFEGGEDCEILLSESQSSENYRKQSKRALRPLAIGFSILATLFLSLTLGLWIGSQHFFNADKFCTAHISNYGPVQKTVDITYNTQRFNGSLMKSNVFRQDASPEVDAAWESLGVDYRSALVPEDEAAKAGILPDQVKVNKKYGGGFPANVEGLHHLHCLNLLRQSSHYSFDYYKKGGQGAFKNSDEVLKFHITHCLDILRQQLMCTVDIGVLGQVWLYPNEPTAYVDFNTNHKCRNFDDVRKWAEKNQMPEDVPDDFLQGPVAGDTIYEEMP